MTTFKVVTPAGTSYGAPGANYDYEMEALAPLGAEIVEIAAKGEDEFAAAARECDALYAKVNNMRLAAEGDVRERVHNLQRLFLG